MVHNGTKKGGREGLGLGLGLGRHTCREKSRRKGIDLRETRDARREERGARKGWRVEGGGVGLRGGQTSYLQVHRKHMKSPPYFDKEGIGLGGKNGKN